jgi:hypothetical protein
MSFMEGIHIGKYANECFFDQIGIVFVLPFNFTYCLPFKKNLIFSLQIYNFK